MKNRFLVRLQTRPLSQSALWGQRFAAALLCGLFGSEALAQTPREPQPPPAPVTAPITRDATSRPTMRAVRVNGGIDVDGQLSEAFYAESPPADNLVQVVPVQGGMPSER